MFNSASEEMQPAYKSTRVVHFLLQRPCSGFECKEMSVESGAGRLAHCCSGQPKLLLQKHFPKFQWMLLMTWKLIHFESLTSKVEYTKHMQKSVTPRDWLILSLLHRICMYFRDGQHFKNHSLRDFSIVHFLVRLSTTSSLFIMPYNAMKFFFGSISG